MVALAPSSVAAGLPAGLAAVALSDADQVLETRLLWRDGDPAPALERFRTVARTVYAPA